jgi:hypothetical protein
LASGSPKQFYVDWARQFEEVDTRKIPQYDAADIFCQEQIVGYDVYNPVTNHLKELDEWLADHEGWRVEWGCI